MADEKNTLKKKKKPSMTEEVVMKHIKNKAVLSGKISIVSRDKNSGESYAVVIFNGWKFTIFESDMDSELSINSLSNFINRKVQFVITEITGDKTAKASRALAQKQTQGNSIEKIESGVVLNGQVVNILPHGAYIDIDGVTGLLKNIDFARDITSIKDVLNIGDNIKVKFKKRSSNGTILFEAATKYVSPEALTIDDVCPDSIVSGVVRAVQPFGVFVQVVVDYDALCSNKNMRELEEDEKVSVRITMVDKETKKIRGEILSKG